MRLIDADALYEAFERTPWMDNADRDIAEEVAENAPTVAEDNNVHVKQPDPITGLAPCGCGGIPGYAITVNKARYTKASVICTKCGFESVTYYTKDHAKDAWNAAMGYTASPRPGATGPGTGEMAQNGEGAGE